MVQVGLPAAYGHPSDAQLVQPGRVEHVGVAETEVVGAGGHAASEPGNQRLLQSARPEGLHLVGVEAAESPEHLPGRRELVIEPQAPRVAIAALLLARHQVLELARAIGQRYVLQERRGDRVNPIGIDLKASQVSTPGGL